MQPLWIYHQALRSAAAAEIVPPSGEASASETRSSCSMKLVLTSRDKLDAASSSEPPHSLSTRSMICLPMLGKMAHSRSTAGVDILLEMDETDEHHESSPSGVSVVASLLHELSLPVGVTVTMGFAGVAAVAVAVACELDSWSCPAGPTHRRGRRHPISSSRLRGLRLSKVLFPQTTPRDAFGRQEGFRFGGTSHSIR